MSGDPVRIGSIKLGAVVVEIITVVRLHLNSHHPLQDLFRRVLAAFVPD